MLKLKLIILFIILSTSISFAQQADRILGEYRLPNKMDIRIFKYKGKYYGKIIALNGFEDGQTKDIKNPESSERNKPLIGKIIIRNLEYDSDEKEWINATIYGVEKGMILNFKITKSNQKEIEVVASKYLFWRTLNWKRIK